MLKTFRLDEREDHQISDTMGTVTFHITDENNDSRTISAETYLDENKQAQGVTSKNKRELPLIEGLFRLELDETIEIEFKHFNKLYNRDLNKTANQLAYDEVLEIEKEKSVFYRLRKLFNKVAPKEQVPASTSTPTT